VCQSTEASLVGENDSIRKHFLAEKAVMISHWSENQMLTSGWCASSSDLKQGEGWIMERKEKEAILDAVWKQADDRSSELHDQDELTCSAEASFLSWRA
jgi:hypothetical protein